MVYIVPDILWSNYYDAVGNLKLDDDLRVRLSGQFGVQGSNGLNLLTGTSFGTFMAGLKTDVIWGPLTFTVTLNMTTVYTQSPVVPTKKTEGQTGSRHPQGAGQLTNT